MKKLARDKVLGQWRGYYLPDMGKAIRSLAEIIPSTLAGIGLGRRFKETAIQDNWKELMGDFVAAHTHPAGLQRNILSIEVDHSVWLHEITLLHKKIMLDKLRQRFPDLNIKELRFRLRG